MENSPYLRLPVEIVRTIIEEGARLSPRYAIKLLTLSSTTRQWVELVLYRKVVINSQTQLRMFIGCMLSDMSKQYRLPQLGLDQLTQEFTNSPSTLRRCSLIRYLWVIPTMRSHFIDVLLPLIVLMPNLVHLAWDTCDADRHYSAVDSLAPACPTNWRLRRLTIIHSRKPEEALATNALDLFLPHLTHLHVVSPGPAFYERFDGVPERGVLPLIDHLALDITASYTDASHGIPEEDMMPLRTIRDGELVPLGFTTEASELSEVFVRVEQDVPDSCFSQLLERAQGDPRLSLVRVPQPPTLPNQIRFFDTLDTWQKKVHRALRDVAEHWNKPSAR